MSNSDVASWPIYRPGRLNRPIQGVRTKAVGFSQAGCVYLLAVIIGLFAASAFAGESPSPEKLNDSGTCVSCSGKTSILLTRGVTPGSGGRQDPSGLADFETIAFTLSELPESTPIEHKQVNGTVTEETPLRTITVEWGTGPSQFGKTDSVPFRRLFKSGSGATEHIYTAIDPEIGATLIYNAASAPAKFELFGVDGSYVVQEGQHDDRIIKIFNPSGRLIHHETPDGNQRKIVSGTRQLKRNEGTNPSATGGPTTSDWVELTESDANDEENVHVRTVIHDGLVNGVLHRRRVTTIDHEGAIHSTIYVYHPSDGDDQDSAGHLWFEVGPAGVARMLVANGKLDAGVIKDSPEDQCGLDRWEEEGTKPFVTDDELKEHASYINVAYDENERVTERISFGPGGCGSCPGGEAVGATYVYGTSPRFTKVTEPSGLRTVTIYNSRNQVQYTIRTYVEDDVQSSDLWIEHNIYDEQTHQLTERRGVVACSNYDVNLANWNVTPVDSNEGIVDLYEYDDEGYLIAHKRKNGTLGEPHWVSRTVYSEDPDTEGKTTVNDITVKRPTKKIHYPILTDESDHDSKRVTTYEYEFYDNSHAIKTLTVTRPAVPTAMNGDGSTAAITRTFYQK
ncbi:MAG: hypothetical protein JJU36_03335, partial [Phycisphaeraceae bacterium]|nr:hypothetical protein [Phycisphaeraceae bacterium]